MIQFFFCGEIHYAAAHTSLGVAGTEYNALHSRVQHRTYAHHARLQRDVKLAINEAVVFEVLRRLAQRDDFGVRGGIARRDELVETAANDDAIFHDNRPHRNFAGVPGALCQYERFTHKSVVVRAQAAQPNMKR